MASSRTDDEDAQLMVGWFCPFAQRAWIASGLSTMSFRVHKHAMELNDSVPPRYMLVSDELAEMTPAGTKPTLPTLRLGDHLTLNDSIPIVCTALGPPGARELRRAEHWDALLCSGGFYHAIKDSSWVAEWEAGLGELEDALAKQPFLSGQRPGLLDCVVFPFVYRAVTVKMFERYRGKAPHVEQRTQAWLERMLSHEAVRRTLPKDADKTGFSQQLQDAYQTYAEGRPMVSLVPRARDEPADDSVPEELRAKFIKAE
jgi:hypothetical protein